MEIDHQLKSVWDEIEHLAKNKLQALFGGSFLVESGLRNEDWQALERGWQIVSKNQWEVARCIQNLISLGQSAHCSESCELGQLIADSVMELGEFAQRDGLQRVILSPDFECTDSCWVDSQSVRSALIGLMRICLEAGRGSTESETLVACAGGRIRLTCRNPQFRWDAIGPRSETDSDLPARLRETMYVEWTVAELTIQRQRGRVEVAESDHQFELTIVLPTERPNNR